MTMTSTRQPPRASILLPVYNGEPFLRAALDSIFSQTFPDFELIVIDDGSTDRTADVLRSYCDPRLKIFRQEHLGLIPALQHAHRRATADYLARMDADDRSHPDRLLRQAEYLDLHPEIDVVTCRCRLLDADGRDTGFYTPELSDDLELDLAAGNAIVHGSVMIRRAAFDAAGGYAEPPEDYALWIRLASAGHRFHVLDDVLYSFRTHPGRYSLTHARSQSAGLLRWQLPLVTRCAATRDLTLPNVRAKVIRGFGEVARSAYLTGDRPTACQALASVKGLTARQTDPAVRAAFDHAVEAVIWAGCPTLTALALRLGQCWHRPLHWRSYRDLVLCVRPVQTLHRRLRGQTRC